MTTRDLILKWRRLCILPFGLALFLHLNLFPISDEQRAWAQTTKTATAPAGSTSNAEQLKTAKVPGSVVLDPAFVSQFRSLIPSIKDNAWDLRIPAKYAKGPALDELKLLVAEALAAKDLSLSAQIVYLNVAQTAMGTAQGAWAIYGLNQLAAQNEINEDMMEEFAYEYEGSVDNVPERRDERSMLAYFKARALVRRGYTDWAIKELEKVSADSQWQADRLFSQAAELVADGRADEAEVAYNDLINRESIRKSTKEFSELNRARLIFERGNYQEVIETLRTTPLPMRERARVLLEMAWAQYYSKEYGKALGILRVIDSAFYEKLRLPETDLLRMVIERDLCRYDLIKDSAKNFRKRYESAFKQIESRLRLEDSDVMKQIALQSRNIQTRATLINQYRQELNTIRGADLRTAPGLKKEIYKKLQEAAYKAEYRINRLFPRELEKVASSLIDLRDQVSFLEYEASIRPLTTLPADEVDYQPVPPSTKNFDRIYWPVKSEAWWDELDHYEVLIRARCAEPISQNLLRPPPKPKPTPVQYDDEDDDDEDDE